MVPTAATNRSQGDRGRSRRRVLELDDAPMQLELPAWAHVVAATSVWLTAAIAAFVYLGTVTAALVGITGLAAGAAWLRTTYRRPARRRTISLYIVAVVVLLAHAGEQHLGGYSATIAALWPGAAPASLDQQSYLAAVVLAPTAIYLFGGVGLVLHHRLGNALAWWVFTWSIVLPISHFALWVVADFRYVPGMATAAVPIVVGAMGVRRLRTDRIEGGDLT